MEVQKCDLNQENIDKSTPVALACRYNQKLEIIKYLVEEKKFDLTQQNRYGFTSFTHACKCNQNLEVIKYLIEERKFNLKQTDGNGNTSLMHACANNQNLEVIKYLIEKGADLNPTNNDGDTALYLACYHNANFQVIRYLVETATEKQLKVKGSDNKTPLETFLLRLLQNKITDLNEVMKKIIITFLLKGPRPSENVIDKLKQNENSNSICELLSCSRQQLLLN